MSKILLYSGEYFDFANPTRNMIRLEDICHNLSKEQRFGNNLGASWSVAHHSLLVKFLYERTTTVTNKKYLNFCLRSALLHDAPEAYISDVPTPLKNMCKDLLVIETRIAKVIEDKYNVEIHPMSQGLKTCDRIAFKIEALLFSTSPDKYSELFTFNKDSFNRLNKTLNFELGTYINNLLILKENKISTKLYNEIFKVIQYE